MNRLIGGYAEKQMGGEIAKGIMGAAQCYMKIYYAVGG